MGDDEIDAVVRLSVVGLHRKESGWVRNATTNFETTNEDS